MQCMTLQRITGEISLAGAEAAVATHWQEYLNLTLMN